MNTNTYKYTCMNAFETRRTHVMNTNLTHINIHVYSKNSKTSPTKYTLTLLDVNPYREVYVMQGELTKRGEIVRLPGFTLDEEGVVTDVWSSDKIVVGAKNRSAVSDTFIPATASDEMVRQQVAQEDDI